MCNEQKEEKEPRQPQAGMVSESDDGRDNVLFSLYRILFPRPLVSSLVGVVKKKIDPVCLIFFLAPPWDMLWNTFHAFPSYSIRLW